MKTEYHPRFSLRTLALAGLLCWIPSVALAGQNVVVVVDDSGSMMDPMRSGTRRIQAAKQALNVVLGKLPEDANVGVLALNQGWVIPLQQLDRGQMSQRINQLRANGGTLLGQNLKAAADELLKVRADTVYGDYRLLVVTDGEANDQTVLDLVLPDILTRGLTVDVIGVDMVSDHSLATKVHNYRRADDAQSLETAIAESLAESGDADLVGGDSDFELMEGLPQELAVSVISALTTAQNSPIGGDGSNGTYEFHGGQTVPTHGGGAAPGGSGGGGIALGFVVCIGIVFFGVSVVTSMLKAGRR